jgi:hypothetical protein
MASSFFVCVALLLCAQAMYKPLDHDEHQFVASGWLIGRVGLLPYRDFPYFHLPYLSLLYASLFQFTDHLLLAARLLSVLAALGSAWLMFVMLRERGDDWRKQVIGCAAALVWLFNPISQYASGLAWNHDTSVFFCLLAFAWFVRAQPATTRRNFVLSGLCLAIAIGLRATFVLAIVAFVAVAWFTHERRKIFLSWLSGLLLGVLPLLWLFWLAPAQFIFGNITYAALNTQWRFEHEYERAMDLTGKLTYLFTDVIGLSSTLALLLVFGAMLWLGWQQHATQKFWLAVALTLALFVAAFLPTPTFPQYFFSATPFLVLCIGLATRAWVKPSHGMWLMLGLVLVSLPQGLPLFQQLSILPMPDQWTPLKAHRVGAWIRARAHDGPIVTLAPIYPLEASLPIYPELATGPFAYRVGTLLSLDERHAQRMFTIEDIAIVMEARPPRAFFLGFEAEELEEPFAEYAQAHRYRYQQLPNGKHLWVRP